jgi:hypothetical protein
VPWSAGSQILQPPAFTVYNTSLFFPVIYSVREPAVAHTAVGHSQHCSSTASSEPVASSSSSSSTGSDHTQHESSDSSSSSERTQRPWSEMWRSAGAHALGGGIPGSAAMVVQVRAQAAGSCIAGASCTTAAMRNLHAQLC